MEPYQQRVVDERVELDARREKLAAFRVTPLFASLHENEKERLVRQRDCMTELSEILEERIAAFQFGQDPCSNCGFPGLPCAEKSEVKFVNGDAVCPQCGEVCDYFDTRDRS